MLVYRFVCSSNLPISSYVLRLRFFFCLCVCVCADFANCTGAELSWPMELWRGLLVAPNEMLRSLGGFLRRSRQDGAAGRGLKTRVKRGYGRKYEKKKSFRNYLVRLAALAYTLYISWLVSFRFCFLGRRWTHLGSCNWPAAFGREQLSSLFEADPLS